MGSLPELGAAGIREQEQQLNPYLCALLIHVGYEYLYLPTCTCKKPQDCLRGSKLGNAEPGQAAWATWAGAENPAEGREHAQTNKSLRCRRWDVSFQAARRKWNWAVPPDGWGTYSTSAPAHARLPGVQVQVPKVEFSILVHPCMDLECIRAPNPRVYEYEYSRKFQLALQTALIYRQP